MVKISYLKFICAVPILFSFSSQSFAAKTEWFLGKDRKKLTKLLKGKLIQEIECRDRDSPVLHIGETSYRVTYTDNPKKIKFAWAVGNHFGPMRVRMKKKGYKLVSLNQYRRKVSGLRIPCAVWHKK